MIVLSGSPLLVHEYDTEMFITTDVREFAFDVPYTLHFDGSKVYVYYFSALKTYVDSRADLKIDDTIVRILVGKEVGVAENYIELPPDLFVCFDRTNYPSKFFYRKAQMWIGAQISGVETFGLIIFNGVPNRMIFSKMRDNGVVFEGTGHTLIEIVSKKGSRKR